MAATVGAAPTPEAHDRRVTGRMPVGAAGRGHAPEPRPRGRPDPPVSGARSACPGAHATGRMPVGARRTRRMPVGADGRGACPSGSGSRRRPAPPVSEPRGACPSGRMPPGRRATTPPNTALQATGGVGRFSALGASAAHSRLAATLLRPRLSFTVGPLNQRSLRLHCRVSLLIHPRAYAL